MTGTRVRGRVKKTRCVVGKGSTSGIVLDLARALLTVFQVPLFQLSVHPLGRASARGDVDHQHGLALETLVREVTAGHRGAAQGVGGVARRGLPTRERRAAGPSMGAGRGRQGEPRRCEGRNGASGHEHLIRAAGH